MKSMKKKIVGFLCVVIFLGILVMLFIKSNTINDNMNNLESEEMSDAELLIYSAGTGDLEEVKELLESGMNINIINVSNGMTLLHYAINSGHLDIANYLIENGIDTNVIDNYGNTPLMLAVFAGYEEIYEKIIDDKRINDCDGMGNSLLNLAAFSGNVSIYNDIYSRGCDINKANTMGKTSVYYAGNIKMFENIIEKLNIKDIDNDMCKDLFLNSMSAEMVKYFIEKYEVDVNIVDMDGTNAFVYALRNNNYEVAEELIEQGLNVNYIDNKGMTALMYCAEENMVEYAQLLINNNADISIKTEDGKNAKQIAEEMGSNEILELLGGE